MQRYLYPRAIADHPEGPPDEEVAALIITQIAHLRAAVVEHSNHADLHYRLGVLLRYAGDQDGAIQSLQRAVAIHPQYARALIKLGFALRDAGQSDAAIESFERALEVDPKSIDLHYQLGLIFADREQFARALERFEYAASCKPDCKDYVANLALTLQDLGLLDRASAAWQTLCEATRLAQGPTEDLLHLSENRVGSQSYDGDPDEDGVA